MRILTVFFLVMGLALPMAAAKKSGRGGRKDAEAADSAKTKGKDTKAPAKTKQETKKTQQ